MAGARPAGIAPARTTCSRRGWCGGKAFYQNGTTWTDAAAQEKNEKLKKRDVKFNSDEYFALLKEHPDAAAWLALGNEVDLVIGEELVCVR